MSARVPSKFFVYGKVSDEEWRRLGIADRFRKELIACNQAWHNAETDFRNELCPELYEAMVFWESRKARVARLDREIKQHHSEVRDANAVTDEQRQALAKARRERDQAGKRVRKLRAEWNEFRKRFHQYRNSIADWKNVKSLDRRRQLYAEIDWPEEFIEYAEIWTANDLRKREIFRRYHQEGLGWSTKNEIVDSTKPKFKRDAPGMRYRYGDPPDGKPWTKLCLQFPGGLSMADALAGRNRRLSLTPIYTQHKSAGDVTVYEVRQQIGTADDPHEISYRMKAHRPLRDDDVIQRWALIVESRHRRYVVPTLKGACADASSGTAILKTHIGWQRVEGGIRVARFRSASIADDLVLPLWLLHRRVAATPVQQRSDGAANELLGRRGATPAPGKRQGVAALEEWCADHPDDRDANRLLNEVEAELETARRTEARAARCIEKIYETAVSRLRERCGSGWCSVTDLDRLIRYDTRDLLGQDAAPKPVRRLRQAVAPGKLRALLERHGLASIEVEPEEPGDAREKGVISSYVESLGKKTGTKQQQRGRRSQHGAQTAAYA